MRVANAHRGERGHPRPMDEQRQKALTNLDLQQAVGLAAYSSLVVPALATRSGGRGQPDWANAPLPAAAAISLLGLSAATTRDQRAISLAGDEAD